MLDRALGQERRQPAGQRLQRVAEARDRPRRQRLRRQRGLAPDVAVQARPRDEAAVDQVRQRHAQPRRRDPREHQRHRRIRGGDGAAARHGAIDGVLGETRRLGLVGDA